MARVAQIGIAIGALGAMLMLMALFPGVTGRPPTPGLGAVQMFAFITGYSWFIAGALFYVKFAYYVEIESNLAQQIGTRLAFTGLVMATLAGFPDSLGFGSHGASTGDVDHFGYLQTIGTLASYFLSCIGVLIYALTGPETPETEEGDIPAIAELPSSELDESEDLPEDEAVI
jgi:hypothetical protein